MTKPREAVDHTPARRQQWTDADADVRAWVEATTCDVEDVVGSTLVAVLLHGSLAMGSYYRPKSDVDLLVVVDGEIDDDVHRELAVRLLGQFEGRPSVGGLEVSVVQQSDVSEFVHPLPYEAHFSEKWVDEIGRGGCGPRGRDSDLASHCAAARSRGVALRGDAPESVLGAVPDDAFVASVMEDLRWIVAERGIHESPYYGVLNACRSLHAQQTAAGAVLNKEEGARWGLTHLPPAHHELVAAALECYRSRAAVGADDRKSHGHDWDHDALEALRVHAATAVGWRDDA